MTSRFRADDISGHADGDYPEWLRQAQLDWFPDDLIEKHDGEVTLTTLNGWVLDLPGTRAEEIADDLVFSGPDGGYRLRPKSTNGWFTHSMTRMGCVVHEPETPKARPHPQKKEQ